MLAAPFPTLVRGVDLSGGHFEDEATLDDLHAHGLSLRLRRALRRGALLFLVVRITLRRRVYEPTPAVAIRGTVTMVRPQPDGRYAVTIGFEQYRFLTIAR